MNDSYSNLKKEYADLLKESDRMKNEMEDLRAQIQNLEDDRDHVISCWKQWKKTHGINSLEMNCCENSLQLHAALNNFEK